MFGIVLALLDVIIMCFFLVSKNIRMFESIILSQNPKRVDHAFYTQTTQLNERIEKW